MTQKQVPVIRSSAGYNGDELAPLQVYPTAFAVWNTEMSKLLDSMIAAYGGKVFREGDVLYVGCGRRIPMEGCHCVDLDPRMGEGMQSNQFTHADAMDLPFEDDRFVMTLSSHTLEHLSDAGLALQEQMRVTRVGGIVGAIVPDVRWTAGLDKSHVREFTQDEFIDLYRTVPGEHELHLVASGEAASQYSFFVVWRKI